jgi:hypothetical protein
VCTFQVSALFSPKKSKHSNILYTQSSGTATVAAAGSGTSTDNAIRTHHPAVFVAAEADMFGESKTNKLAADAK